MDGSRTGEVNANHRDAIIYALKDDILIAEFEDGGVAFDTNSRLCLELNTTGVFILGHLDGINTIKMLIRKMAERFEQPKEKLRQDVEIFLDDLHRRGWIHVT